MGQAKLEVHKDEEIVGAEYVKLDSTLNLSFNAHLTSFCEQVCHLHIDHL